MLVAFVRNSFESMRNRIVARPQSSTLECRRVQPRVLVMPVQVAGVGAGSGAAIANGLKSVMRRPFFVRRQRRVIRDHTGNPTSGTGMRPDFSGK
jgi:hypothetical protein